MGDETVTCGHSSQGALVGVRSCSSANRTPPAVGTADAFFLLFLETRSPRSRASRVGFQGGHLVGAGELSGVPLTEQKPWASALGLRASLAFGYFSEGPMARYSCSGVGLQQEPAAHQ